MADLLQELNTIARNIKLIVMDVDGVLTDGRIIYDSVGNELKEFDVRDGSRVYYAQKMGLTCAIITGRWSTIVERRASEMGISETHQGVKNKWKCLLGIMERAGVKETETAYIGDDLLDLPAMRKVALAIAPADACPEVKAIATFITPSGGGRGAVKDGIELILKAQNHWEHITATALVDD